MPSSLEGRSCTVLLLVLLLELRPAASVECQCTHYRCRSELGEFVFAPTEMLLPEAQWCVGNSSAFHKRGECRYCDTNCENNICECKASMTCEWLSITASIICCFLSVLMFLLSVRGCYRHWEKDIKVRAYEADDYPMENWEKSKAFAIVAPFVVSILLLASAVAVQVFRSDYFEDEDQERRLQMFML
eukprot:gnl/TRDRNA2_/TRDRNA2_185095_c0_seq1.p1 gnl/TRDRNA2_/TRDRNA2_185095_c0~~gnl/TRDRNA2_/TRDRNA2_185095_c0_seq1.p1  ORF type:complete len:205 (-),score=36.83 gnl/TRDRNA2_/TRDRNA2_185095_c0_seq1:200-763(-)